MTIETMYFVAQILAAIAIVGTLLYGIAQIRLNNRLARAQLTHEVGTGLHQFMREMGSNPEAARVWRLGTKGSDELTPDERTQFGLLCRSAMIGNEMQFRLYKEGLIAKPVYQRMLHELEGMMRQPGIRAWWARGRDLCMEDFAELVDGLLKRQEPGTP